MVNESGNSSIAFAESKDEVAPEKSGQIPETMISERSIKFHADGASEGEHDPETATSVSLRIESENPHSANSHNPRATNPTPGSVSPTHELHTESQEDIHFDVAETPAPSSVQSVRFQVEESRVASTTGSKVKRETSPQPAEEGEEEEEQHQPATHDVTERESLVDFHEETPNATPPQQPIAPLATTQPPNVGAAAAAKVHDDVEVIEEDETLPPTEAKRSSVPTQESPAAALVADKDAGVATAVDAPTATAAAADVEDDLATYPPPRRVSPRAATAARTPRANGPVPTTPRSRSPNSSYRPAHTAAAEPTPAPAGVPPLAPASENAQAVRAASPAAKPQAFARHPTGNSEFSSIADPEADAAEGDAAAVASVTTPASPNIIITNHTRAFDGPAWAAVVNTSRDTIERTVSNETAVAAGIEAQFVRVTSIEANAEGMTCDMSIGHAPEHATEQIDKAIRECGYENTLLLLDFAAGPSNSAAAAAAAAQEEAETEKSAHSMPFSFNEKVGEGLLVISYSVFPFGSYRHLELSFDGPIEHLTIKYVKECLSGYLGMHESQLVVRRGEEVLSDDATGADLELENGCTLEAQCTISQREDTEDVEEYAAEAKKEEEHQQAPEEPAQSAPVPSPAPQPTAKKPAAAAAAAAAAPKKKKTAKDVKAAPATTKKNQKAAAAPAGKKTAKDTPKKQKKQQQQQQKAAAAAPADKKKKAKTTTSTTKSQPQQPQQQQRHNAANAPSSVPHYASATRVPATGPTPQPSAARSRSRNGQSPLPRLLRTPRRYHAHSVRPGADSLEEGETMATYMSASRSLSLDGTQARSSRLSVSRHSATPAPAAAANATESQSVSRHSASAAPPSPSRHAASIVVTRRSSADARALNASTPLPPQHTIRGVASVAFRPRPVIHAGQPQQPPHVHHADTHSASIRSRSPHPAALDDDDDAAESVNFVEDEVVVVMTEEDAIVVAADDVPMQPLVYAQKEVEVYAEVAQPWAAVEDPQQQQPYGDDEVEFVQEGSQQYDYSGEPQQQGEEDPVPAAAPNPFV